jgi:hypothetical protein
MDDDGWTNLSDGAGFQGTGVDALAARAVGGGSVLAIGTQGCGLYKMILPGPGGGDPALGEPAVISLSGIQGGRGENEVTVSFVLLRASEVSLGIYDLRGRLVDRRTSAILPEGEHVLTWSGEDRQGRRCASGVYLVRLTAGGSAAAGKCVVMR